MTLLISAAWVLDAVPKLPKLLRLRCGKDSWTSLGGIDAEEFLTALYKCQRGLCARCKEKLSPIEAYSANDNHHLRQRAAPPMVEPGNQQIPASDGHGPQCGPNELWNVEALCPKCHRAEHHSKPPSKRRRTV
eukprot:gene2306-biopygen3444